MERTILEDLREQTANAHSNLENVNFLDPLSRTPLSKENYIAILKAFYGYFHPVEILIENHPQIASYLEDFHERRKSDWILKDLNVLDGYDRQLKICYDLPVIDSLSKAFGALYVLEGSTLGGSLIAKRVNEQLGYTPDTGACFFSGYFKETGSRWKKFRESVLSFDNQNNLERQSVLIAANETFQKFSVWLRNY